MASKHTWKLLLLLLFAGCDKFEYSPYQEAYNSLPGELNARNIKRLSELESIADDTITILFSADSQRFYDELEHLVEVTNGIPEVDFFVVAGDLTDFGLLQEFEWIGQRLGRLHAPFICVIGNHDLLGNGLDIYRNTFGPENMSFRYKGYKFIMHDSNGREYGFNGKVPDIAWLSAEANDTTVDYFVGLSHVPPYDLDFDPALEEPYRMLMKKTRGFRLSLHGHMHSAGDSYYYNDGVRYIGGNAIGNHEALLLKLIDGKVIKQLIPY